MVHIDDITIEDPSYSLIDILVKTLKTIKSGKIHIEIQNKSAIDIIATSDKESNKVDIDMLEPELFDLIKDGISDTHNDKSVRNDKETDSPVEKILDKLDGAKEFIQTMTDKDSMLQQQLNLAKNFARKLTENNMTVLVMRKGKEALILGKQAKPTVSKIISGSDDLQIKSVIESSKLMNDISPED
ncbi:MAG: hypothetical protein ACRD6Q_08845 [Nitrososphaeraceae archaeon]